MEYNSTMKDFSATKIVGTVLETGSFTAAASRHDITVSAAAKLVTRVEQQLGVKLISRSTRRLKPTTEGEIYLSGMRKILTDIGQVEEEIALHRGVPRGPLRVSCPNFIFVYQVAPRLPSFLERFPQIQLEMNISDRRVDLISGSVDIGVRLGELEDSSLVVRKVCDIFRGLYASPRYLERCGVPRTPQDLLRHECLFSNQAAGLDRWLFRTETGTEHLKVSTRLSLDDSVAVLLSGLAGLGIIQISDIVSGGPVSRGELVPVLADYYAARPIALSLVMPPGKKRSARVSAFVDFFISEFGHAPWRSPATEGKVKGAARKSSGR